MAADADARKRVGARQGSLTTYKRAADLPPEWDLLAATNPFLSRSSLRAIESVHGCEQSYTLLSAEAPESLFVAYTHRLNILTYGKGNISIPVTIVGIPCSVSSPGCIIGNDTREAAAAAIASIRGARLVLNTPAELSLPRLARGRTLPTCRLDIAWDSFGDYLAALRSHYRYRMKAALQKWEPVAAVVLDDPADFDEELYRLYLNVYERSRYKIERLPIAFFQTFPAQLITFTRQGRVIGFVQMLEMHRELHFLFGGMDYAVSRRVDTYLNMLLHMVRYAIERRCKAIDLGQTAEETKMRLGCRLVPRHFFAGHSNRLADFVIQRVTGPLSYRPPQKEFHVFR
jgi:hypothetical protein